MIRARRQHTTIGDNLQGRIWSLAWPALLANISIPLLGLVDTAILGHLDSPAYIGAVAVGASILSFLYWGFSFLRMGTTGLVARAYGARDESRQRLILAQSIVLALILATLVFALHRLWLDLGLRLIEPGSNIEPLARSYTYIRVYSAPAVLVTYAIVGCFIGRQNTRWPLAIVITTNGINVALDFLFVLGLGMDSDGAALATVVAEYAGCLLALRALRRSLQLRPDRRLWRELSDWHKYRELLDSNRHLFVRTLCLLFSFAFFTAQSAGMGDDQLAANSIMLNLLLLAAYAMDGFAFAVEALCGEAAGARDMPFFYRAVRGCSFWCLTTALLFSGFFALGGALIFPLFSQHPQITALLYHYQWWLVALPLVAAASYLLDGIFIGTAMTRYMMLSMLFSTACIYLPSFYLLRAWGNNGLWLSFLLFNAARGISLGLCLWYLSRRSLWL